METVFAATTVLLNYQAQSKFYEAIADRDNRSAVDFTLIAALTCPVDGQATSNNFARLIDAYTASNCA